MSSSELTDTGKEARLNELALLGLLPSEVSQLVVEAFVRVHYAFGETIFAAGDPADAFYFLDSGLVRVVGRHADGEEVSLNLMRPGDAFGEAGLLDGSPRTATVRTASDVEAFRLDASIFQALSHLHPSLAEAFAIQPRIRRLGDFLRVHSAFSRLPPAAIAPMLDALTTVELAPGAVAVSEGDPPTALFIVEHGRLHAFSGTGPDRHEVGFLRTGDFFGERSLYTGEPAAATVEALDESRLLRLSAEDFAALVAEHAELRARIVDRVRTYAKASAGSVPLDFAELLPAEAAEPGPGLQATEDGLGAVAELPAADGRTARAARARPGRRPRFPHVRQIDEMDCGAACVAMVCRHFGREVAASHIRMAVGTSADGTSLRGLQRGGEHVGLEMEAVKASRERLDELPLPAILHWETNHWVVLFAVDGEHVHVADPARGLRRMSRAEALEKWSGYAALPSPTPRLADAPLARASAEWLWALIRPHRNALLIGLALAFAAAGLEMLFPVLTQQVVDHVLVRRNYTLLYELTGGMLVLLVVSLAVTIVQRRLLTRVAVDVDTESLDYITARMLRLPMSYFETRRIGDINRRLDGVRQIREMALQGGLAALTAASQFVVALVIMAVYSRLMFGLFLLTVPLYALMMRYAGRRVAPTYEALEEEYGRFRSRQIDAVRGIATVKAMGREDGIRRVLVENLRVLAQRMFRSQLTLMVYGGVTELVTFVTVVAFLFIGALEVLAHHLTIGGLIAFNSLILLANAPLGTLLGLWDSWLTSRVLLGRLQDIFDYGEEQPGPAESYRPVPTLAGRVAFRRAGFWYPQAPASRILDGISIEIPPASTVGVVGRSGAGKSTLVKCLAGLLELNDGQIVYDGVDLRELNLRELRQRIGYVLQEPYLFDDTIAVNIAFGEEEADPAKVRAAAELADAADFIERLPLGYQTRVGESGMRLSGGQVQRIAIARALYHEPPVLIFDEATSALDAESERTVRQNLARMLEGRTAFLVAHRLSTIRDADLILVLEQGRLVESGTHEALMSRDGLYSYLVGQQLT